MKISKIGVEARDSVIRGANYLADAITSTLGPGGKNGLTEKSLRVSNDGKYLASEMELKDEFENLGLRKLREATEKTNSAVGDGTSTATCLAQAIIKSALPFLEKQGSYGSKKTVMEVVNQINKESAEVVAKLNAMAKQITTEQELIESATVSAEDKELGILIGKAQYELGKEGILLAEKVNAKTTTAERVNGIVVENGFSTSLVINKPEKDCLELEDVPIILTNHTIHDLSQAKDILSQLEISGKKKVVFYARAFESKAVQQCMSATEKGFEIYPVNVPYTDQVEVLKDIQAVIGGNFINQEVSELSDMQLSDIGYASKIVVKRMETVIAGKDNEERIKDRIAIRQKQYEASESDFEKGNLKIRIAQLTNGFTYIKVGGLSDTERDYKFDKAEDACNAVRHAYQEGVVPGAGKALKIIADELPDTYILKKAIVAPYNQIMSTIPQDFVIGDEVVDPVKVVRTCLENACSVAGTLATIGIVIANERPKKIDELLRNTNE